jgi:hypothetical protein
MIIVIDTIVVAPGEKTRPSLWTGPGVLSLSLVTDYDTYNPCAVDLDGSFVLFDTTIDVPDGKKWAVVNTLSENEQIILLTKNKPY